MSWISRSDLILEMDEVDIVELLDDERVGDDRKTSKAYQFQCDTANTSGHFENEAGTAVTIGPAQTCKHLVTGVRFRLLSTWYTIGTITTDGSGNNAVAFTGGTLAAATYEVELFEPATAADRLDRKIADAEAEVSTLLREMGIDPSGISMDGSVTANVVRFAAVAFTIRNLFSRRASFDPEKQPWVVIRANQAKAALKTLAGGESDLTEIGYRDGEVSISSETSYVQQAYSRRKLRGW